MLNHLFPFYFVEVGVGIDVTPHSFGQENDPSWDIQVTVKDGLWERTKSFLYFLYPPAQISLVSTIQ